MQNHPHDSICGCSVDEVHREMMTRFEKANEVGKYLADDALFELAKVIDFEEMCIRDRCYFDLNRFPTRP